MSVTQDKYEIALLRLRQAYRAAREFSEFSQDWTAKVEMEVEFKHLLREVKEFARCQYGIGATRDVDR